MSSASGRVPVSGRVAVAGRVAASGRVSALSRRGYPFTLGLRAFYRPDVGTVTPVAGTLADGGKISRIADQSGTGLNSSTQGTSIRQPTWTASALNGAPALTWNGSNFISIPFAIMQATTNWTQFGVFRSTNNSGARCPFFPCATQGAGMTINAGGTGKREIRLGGVGNISDAAATTNFEAWIITRSTTTMAMYNGTAGTVQTLDLPAVSVLTPTGSTSVLGAITSVPQFGWVGDICEIGYVQRLITANEIAGYLAYVAARYGAL